MATFEIKKPVPGIDENTKGGILEGKNFITGDAVWIKELRKHPTTIVEEVAEPEPE